MIQLLKNYKKTAGGKEQGYPIMNIQKEGPGEFFAIVSIQTTAVLPSKGEFELKQMFLGKVLTAEVKGSIYTVQTGEEELARFVSDYHKISPAISFQSLVNDRPSESATTKWVTWLLSPIF